MIETKIGLPNTCSICGKPAWPTWWADNEDVARSGGGMHAECMTPPAVESETPIIEVVEETATHRATRKKAK